MSEHSGVKPDYALPDATPRMGMAGFVKLVACMLAAILLVVLATFSYIAFGDYLLRR